MAEGSNYDYLFKVSSFHRFKLDRSTLPGLSAFRAPFEERRERHSADGLHREHIADVGRRNGWPQCGVKYSEIRPGVESGSRSRQDTRTQQSTEERPNLAFSVTYPSRAFWA